MEEMDVKQIKHTAAQNIIISEVKNCLRELFLRVKKFKDITPVQYTQITKLINLIQITLTLAEKPDYIEHSKCRKQHALSENRAHVDDSWLSNFCLGI